MHKIKCCLPSTESVGVLSLEGLLFCALCCDSWHYWWRHVAIHSNRYSAGTPLCELKSSTCFTCKVNSTNETNSTRTRGSSDPPGRLSGAKETRERFETESPRSNCLDIRTGTWRAPVLCSFNSFLGGVLSLVCVLARTSQFCDPRRETIFLLAGWEWYFRKTPGVHATTVMCWSSWSLDSDILSCRQHSYRFWSSFVMGRQLLNSWVLGENC